MDFLIYPANGYLNTRFGFKINSVIENFSYRFVFVDEGIKTEWTKEDVFVYFTFKSAGEKTIILEIKDRESITKKIEVQNSIYFGNGITEAIYIANKSNKLIILKSIGLKIFDILTKDEFSLKFSFNEFIEIDIDKIIIILRNKKIGILNLSNGNLENEFLGDFQCYNENNKLVVLRNNDFFQIVNVNNNSSIRELGQIKWINEDCSMLIYELEKKIYSYNISVCTKLLIGEFEFVKPLNESNDDYLLFKNRDKNFIYDTFFEKTIFSDIDSTSNIKINSFHYIGKKLTKKESLSKRSKIISIKISPRIKTLITIKYNKLYISIAKLKILSSLKTNPEKVFVRWIDNGRYYVIKENEVYSLVKYSNKITVYKTQNEIIELINYHKLQILIEYCDNKFSHFINLKSKQEIFKIKGYLKKENVPNLISKNQLWISNSKYSSSYRIYESLSNNLLLTLFNYKESDNYYLTESNIISKKDFSILHSFAEDEKLITFSDDLKIIIFKNEKEFFFKKNILSDNKTQKNSIQLLDKIYKSSEIFPNGDKIVLSSNNESEIIDLSSFKRIKILKTNFIKFDANGNLLCSDQRDFYWGNPRLFDPNTFEEITPVNICKYQYVSPDGRFSISVKKNKYLFFDITSGNLIGEIENSYPYLDYTNFISFCPNTNLLCIAGKISYKTGNLKFITYEVKENELKYNWIKPFSTNYAIWKCDFSRFGSYLGAYDSIPTTYIFKISNNMNYLFKTINNRSFECFSPDENNVVLSNNKYEAITAGGKGWITSHSLWIVSINDLSTIREFCEHNDEIVYATYSQDGTKLLSRSKDGIVIVRNSI